MESNSLGAPLARGRTADVYAWEGNTVLKLYHDWFEIESIEYERRMVDAVCASGVDTPAVLDLIKVAGRNGLVYERVDGRSMLDGLLGEPWRVVSFARLLAQLHSQMHRGGFITDMPSQRRRLQTKIGQAKALSDAQKESLLQRLAFLPDGDRVCHGDFFPGNVLLTSTGARTIDWIDVTRGNPLADVARTSIILKGISENQAPNVFIKWFVRLFHQVYLRRYFELRPQNFQEYLSWLPIVAGARLSENIPELEAWLVKQSVS